MVRINSTSNYPGIEATKTSIRITFQLEGKQHRQTIKQRPTQANLKQAYATRKQIINEINMGVFDWSEHFPHSKYAKKQQRPLFQEYAESWLINASELELSTREGYLKLLNRFWIPAFGNMPIDTIKKHHIKDVLANSSHLSGKTLNNAMTPLRQILNDAWYDELIHDDPTKRIKSFTHQKPTPDPLTLAEAWKILDYLNEKQPDWINYFQLAFFAGLRTSEIIGLKWGDVDWNEKKLRIQRARVCKTSKSTKTNRIRDVKLNSIALQALKNQREKTFLAGEWIYTHPATGKQINDDKPPRMIWNAALKSTGIRHRVAYQTRHTCATLMIMSGEKPAWCAEQLGHSVRMFLEVYAKWIQESEDSNEGNRMERMINKKTDSARYSAK